MKQIASTDPVYSISVAAERAGVSVPTLRLYETEGLLVPYRRPSGHRLFSDHDLERVARVRRMVGSWGLNFEGIRRLFSMIPCWAEKGCSEGVRGRCPAFVEVEKPCWAYDVNGCDDIGRDCRTCEVYLTADVGELKGIWRRAVGP